jgi:hypothetical protein
MRIGIIILLLLSTLKIYAQKIEKNLLYDNWKIVNVKGRDVSKNIIFVFQINDSSLVFAAGELKYSLEVDNIF